MSDVIRDGRQEPMLPGPTTGSTPAYDDDDSGPWLSESFREIERLQVALAEALRLLEEAEPRGTALLSEDWYRRVDAFLAAHPAPQGEVEG